MTADDQRDRALETMLRTRGTPPGPAGPCLDADVLAAWVDGTLDERSLNRAEAHMADCARCQAAMAALVASEPEPLSAPDLRPVEPSSTRWWPFGVRWLVPIAGAATAVLVWSLSPDGDRTASQITEEKRQVAVDADPPPAQRDPPPATPKADIQARAEAPPPPAPAAAAPLAAGELDTPAARADTAPAERSARATTQAFSIASSGEIASSDPSVRWRLNGAAVERSTDGGRAWTLVDQGAPATLIAGSAPAATVCWLVGRGGTIRLTTDARTWTSVTSPTADDLVFVDASDERRATIRARSGAEYRTMDGGTTWTRLP